MKNLALILTLVITQMIHADFSGHWKVDPTQIDSIIDDMFSNISVFGTGDASPEEIEGMNPAAMMELGRNSYKEAFANTTYELTKKGKKNYQFTQHTNGEDVFSIDLKARDETSDSVLLINKKEYFSVMVFIRDGNTFININEEMDLPVIKKEEK